MSKYVAASVVSSVLLVVAGSASAAPIVITGMVLPDGSYPYYETPSINLSTGYWRFSFELTRPASGVTIDVPGEEIYNYFNPITGHYNGGNEIPYEFAYEFYPDVVGGTSPRYALPRDYVYSLGPDESREGYFDAHVRLIIEDLEEVPISYRLTATYLGEIPEPTTWTMLALGFGTAGVALRRRLRVA